VLSEHSLIFIVSGQVSSRFFEKTTDSTQWLTIDKYRPNKYNYKNIIYNNNARKPMSINVFVQHSMNKVLSHCVAVNVKPCNCVLPACRVGADVAILISGSGIIGQQNYQVMLNFTRQLVYGVNVNRKDGQVAVVVFSDNADIRFYLNDFNNFTLPSPSSSSYPNDYVYTQLHALGAISNNYPYAFRFLSHFWNTLYNNHLYSPEG